MKGIVIAALGVLFTAGAALATSPGSPDAKDSREETPRRQVVDLKKLEIEGEVPVPSTLFIRERGPGAPYELFSLRRTLPAEWFRPVVKSAFDRETWNLVDRSKR